MIDFSNPSSDINGLFSQSKSPVTLVGACSYDVSLLPLQ
jgi:hypothetical protein